MADRVRGCGKRAAKDSDARVARTLQAELEEKQQQLEALDTMFKATSLQLRETETALTRTADQLENTQSALGQVRGHLPAACERAAAVARRALASAPKERWPRHVCPLEEPLSWFPCAKSAARCANGAAAAGGAA